LLRVGVDVGGTFTDVVVFDDESGRLWLEKVPTTPRKPTTGIMDGVRRAVGDPARIGVFVHATTIGTNMFLGQVGIEPPPAVLITNRGFRDILEIGRQNRPSLYDPYFQKPRPLIPRDRRVGVHGRVGPGGEELEPLDVEEVGRAAREWCGKGVRVYAVSFLHSYANPSHEALAKQAILDECPGSTVVASHEVDPAPLEYERTSTTVVNALLMPVLSRYLAELEEALRGAGFRGKILVMQSSGGVASIEEALRLPAAFIESGPSAGAVAVAYFSRLMGVDRALGFDMGGTTAKASSIIGGEPEVVDIYEVGGRVHMGRVIRGSGYPVRFPHIDLAEVSAGGGTIAWVDPGGGLRLGPLSAGADPGPAAYGRGGTEPTVTDANLVLGRLPEVLASGLRLRRDLAERAIMEKVARPLGLDLVEAAWAIVRLANTIMGRALRLVSVERGHDPRAFTMYAFGGAGPLHALELAGEVGVSRVVVPPMPGVFSALGLLVADYRHDYHYPIVKRAEEVDEAWLETVFRALEERAVETLRGEGVPRERIVLRRYVDARYWGQARPLRVPYPGSVEALVEEFHRLHEARYGFRVPGEPVVLEVARVEAVGVTEKPVLRAPAGGGEALVGERRVYFEDGWHMARVYRYGGLAAGSPVEGPAVVEYPDSTLVVPPGWSGRVEEHGALVLERG